ncbi:putative Glycoside hydrolase superfamily [Seiridium cardinale]|uniref:Alpha-galactosidase n=1 Tax=Seiridium cardinale TaxID=138064 RepID=A0ABR2Y233_9PEZI
MSRLLLLVLASLVNGLAQKPQMGWNSWNTFKSSINESVILNTADVLVSSGLTAVGYNYLLLDEGWSGYRDINGLLQANVSRFPNGITKITDYAHERDLKVGIYGDAGIMTCAFRPGSYGYEELDAATFASWGIDYLKYDNCGGFHAATYSSPERFWRMAHALKMTGRDIFFSLCQWGNQFPWLWADQLADSYRMSGDIHSSFASDSSGVCTTAYCLNTGYAGVSVLTMIRKMRELSSFQKPGAWADMDMLEIGNAGMTEFEEQTHFSFWAALKSPLIIGANLATINQTSLDVLLNQDIIAINQDDAGIAVNYVPALSSENTTQVWAGPLISDGAKFVILVLNEQNFTRNITVILSQVPKFADHVHGKTQIRDVWAKADLGQNNGTVILKNVEVHETKVLVFS